MIQIERIEKIENDKKKFLQLLLLADPEEKMLDRYLFDGDMYALLVNEDAVCVAVVVKLNTNEYELKNIATNEEFQKQGYASKLLKYIFQAYSNSTLYVGTSENGVAFYKKQGFEDSHIIKNFFVDNYSQPIFEGDHQCIDMIYLKLLI